MSWVRHQVRSASPAVKFVLLVVLGSVAIGLLFDVSLGAVTAFAVAVQLGRQPDRG